MTIRWAAIYQKDSPVKLFATKVIAFLINMAHVDRISNLPEPLLHHILSFLTSQEAVQTCVLSKRWEKLWAYTHSLDLSLPDFKTRSARVERRFTKFVDMVLSQRDYSDLHAFGLFCEEQNFTIRHRLILKWVLYAVRHNAKVIEIDACEYSMLPRDIFTSKSLEELDLAIFGLGRGIISGVVNLPRLKKLHLHGIMSRKRGILTKLLSGCPALEDLYIETCTIDMSFISSPQLKYLTIVSWLDRARIESIRAPNLISLHLDLCGDVLEAANLEKMPFLVNARISVHRGTGFDAVKCNVLPALSNVRNLELRGNIMKDLLTVEVPKCPTFFNLTNLHLSKFCRGCRSNVVDGILKLSPNLKKLRSCENTWGCQCEDDNNMGNDV